MRKSSRGNPYHDERGRFASADKHKTVSERTPEEYQERTNQRFGRTFFNGDIEEGLRSKAELERYRNHITDLTGESDWGYESQIKRTVGMSVTVRNLGGASVKGKIVGISKDYNGFPVYKVETEEIGSFSCGDHYLDSCMTSDDIQRDKADADRLRAENAHKYAKSEILFVGINYSRCHAAIVDKLPEKTSRWSNGYAALNDYEQDGKVYTVYKDRDDHGQFSYFAVERKDS